MPVDLYSLLNVWLRSTMFYDNAINRVYGKKPGPHYTTLKKNYPWGSDFEPNQSKIYFFAAWLGGPQKYDMSISQMPKRVNLSPRSFFHIIVLLLAKVEWFEFLKTYSMYIDRNRLGTDKIVVGFLACYKIICFSSINSSIC